MKSVFGESTLDVHTLEAARDVAFSDTSNFSALLKLTDINPAHELRYSDLSQVNFSDVDFSGFDFTGADLRGAYGVEVKNLNSAIITDADVSASLFEFSKNRKDAFRLNPELKNEADTILKRDWRGQHDWIEPAVERLKEGDVGLKFIAQTLLEESDDLTVRTSLLYFMEQFFQSASEWASYIRHMIAIKPQDHPVFEYAAKLYAFDFMVGDEAKEVLLALLPHSNFTVKRYSILGLSRLFHKGVLSQAEAKRIRNYTEGPALANYRRELLLRNAVACGHWARSETVESRLRKIETVRDFIEPLDDVESEDLKFRKPYYLQEFEDEPRVEAPKTDVREIRRQLADLWAHSKIGFRSTKASWLKEFYNELERRNYQEESILKPKRIMPWTPIQKAPRKKVKSSPELSESKKLQMIIEEMDIDWEDSDRVG